MKTIVYVDGFNLYFGALKNTPYRWLNVAAMCQTLLPGDEILRINYFTALVDPRPGDPDKRSRQQTFCERCQRFPSYRSTTVSS